MEEEEQEESSGMIATRSKSIRFPIDERSSSKSIDGSYPLRFCHSSGVERWKGVKKREKTDSTHSHRKYYSLALKENKIGQIYY